MQSSRPLYMSKQVKSLSERAEARVFLFLIYVICHHMLQLIKIRAELFYIQASFCNKSNLPFCFLHKKKQMFIIYRSLTHSIMSILKLRSLSWCGWVTGCSENVSSFGHYSEAEWRAAERFRLQMRCSSSGSEARLTSMPLSLRLPHVVISLNQWWLLLWSYCISSFIMIWRAGLVNWYFALNRPSNWSVFCVFIGVQLVNHEAHIQVYDFSIFRSLKWWINNPSSTNRQ